MKTTNKVELAGYVGIAPEVKELSNGSKLANFTIATHESYKNKKGDWEDVTTWHHVSMWNKTAEKAIGSIQKGSQVQILGKLVSHSYTDKQGNKRTVVEVVATSFEMIEAAA